ncbi:MAG: hypothetical protein WEA34_07185 [Gemmatimonadota bacterium]
MWTSPRALVLTLLLVAPGVGATPALAQDASFGDRSRLAAATPLGVQAVVEWDDLITETAGGATEDQFHDAVIQTFENKLAELGVSLDPAAERFLLCRVETLYDSGLIAFAARVELHEPFGDGSSTAITWHQTWIGTTPVRGMHMLFTIGEQCAEDFVEARGDA